MEKLAFQATSEILKAAINIQYYVNSNGGLFMRSREDYFIVYYPSCAASREINTKKHSSGCINSWHNESINDDKNDDLHTSFPCLTRSG